MSRDHVVSDLRALADLLERPEPGLSSWHAACETVWQRIVAALKLGRALEGRS